MGGKLWHPPPPLLLPSSILGVAAGSCQCTGGHVWRHGGREVLIQLGGSSAAHPWLSVTSVMDTPTYPSFHLGNLGRQLVLQA